MFNKIWKEQIVQPTSKVGAFKPKQGFELEEDEDDDCNKKLQEYANKLRNMSFKTKGSPQFNSYWEKQNESGIEIDETMEMKIKGYEEIDYGNENTYLPYGWERIKFRYNPVPEEIACLALKYLKELGKDYRKPYILPLSKDYEFHADWSEYELGMHGVKTMKMYIRPTNSRKWDEYYVILSHYIHTGGTVGNYDEIDIDWR